MMVPREMKKNSMRTERTSVRRRPERGVYDFAAIAAILDEGLVCHVGFAIGAQPYVIPTIYGRVGDKLYIHGSAASRMLRALLDGASVCVTVTLLDGLVLARSAFHHSVNYRSVVIFGRAMEVAGPERLKALEAISEHVIPGRWREVRPPNEAELKATVVLSLVVEEASAKVRTGPPVDDENDYGLGCWAGEIPLRLVPQLPVPGPRLAPDIVAPKSVLNYRRPAPRG